MKTDKNRSDIFSRFLLSPRLRIYRHVLLVLLILIMVLNQGYISPEANTWSSTRVYLFFFSFLTFIAIFYGTIYWAVPRYLLQNRWGRFVGFVVILSIVLLMFTLFIQNYILPDFQSRISEINYFNFGMVLLASSINVCLFSAGISTILLFRHWMVSGEQISELESATLQSELNLLKSQINPHFLFNMLNNINVLLKREPKMAAGVIFKLEDLLRYQLDESVKERVNVYSEICFLRDFLQLEKIRRDNFEFIITEEGETKECFLPPLLFIPFVENAVKYSQDSIESSYVHLSFRVEADKVFFLCLNSKPEQEKPKAKTGGLGLKNIRRRLELLYPEQYVLDISEQKRMYTVKLEIKENKQQ